MVVGDYQATGLTLGQHPLALLRPRLDQLGYADTRRLETVRPGSWIRLPGLVLMRQQPGSAKGIVFLTVEDEHGVGNLVIYPDVAARDRAALVAGRLLLAEGRVEREVEHAELPIIHLIVRKLTDCSDLLDSLTQGERTPQFRNHMNGTGAEDTAWAERSLGRADEVKRPEPGARRPPQAKLQASRDFR
jgi:error-prone DNA polymerase